MVEIPFQRNDGGSRSQLKGNKVDEESSLGANYLKTKKDLSFDNFIIQNGIYKQSLKLQDFDVIDGFLGFLDAQGWLSAFIHPELKVVITLIVIFYYSINW